MYLECIMHVSCMYFDVSRSYTSRYINGHTPLSLEQGHAGCVRGCCSPPTPPSTRQTATAPRLCKVLKEHIHHALLAAHSNTYVSSACNTVHEKHLVFPSF